MFKRKYVVIKSLGFTNRAYRPSSTANNTDFKKTLTWLPNFKFY